MSFNFNPDEAWEVGTSTLLQRGNHVTEITEIDARQTSSGGYPMIEVKTANDDGDIRNWIVISDAKTFGKFTSLVLAAGVPEADYPQPGIDFDIENGRVTQEYAQKLLGRKVGTVVRDEEDKRNPGTMRPAVAGYVLTSAITDDVPIDTRGLPPVPAREPQPQTSMAGSAMGSAADKKIPF